MVDLLDVIWQRFIFVQVLEEQAMAFPELPLLKQVRHGGDFVSQPFQLFQHLAHVLADPVPDLQRRGWARKAAPRHQSLQGLDPLQEGGLGVHALHERLQMSQLLLETDVRVHDRPPLLADRKRLLKGDILLQHQQGNHHGGAPRNALGAADEHFTTPSACFSQERHGVRDELQQVRLGVIQQRRPPVLERPRVRLRQCWVADQHMGDLPPLHGLFVLGRRMSS
mmetsp:Transcript_144656/g.463488  ORF Transcript_144656/g.463488 Transcript_144656/m.463488 type:complete len:224 (+) Transcript_144656:672-1343(+)